MLKLKDNVDLKELEKFGFYKDSTDGKYFNDTGSYCDERVSIFVNEDRTFFIEWGYYVMYGEEQERFLIDLIKAGLVEKVGDNEDE